MKLKEQLKFCIAGSAVLTIITLIFTSIFAEEKGWFSFGPSSHLSIAGVVIDTREKYSILVIAIVFNSVIDMVVSEFAQPILGFNIYNPDKKLITDFKSKRELQVLATLYWSFNNLRTIFTNLVSITQVDLALIKWVILEITAVYTINILLSKKRFTECLEEEIQMV
jgi:hypothetical protein